MVFNLGSTKPIFLFWRLQYPIKGCFFWRYCPHFHFSLQYILNKKKDIVGIICCLFIRIYRIKTIFGNYNKIPLFENILFLKVNLINTLALSSSFGDLIGFHLLVPCVTTAWFQYCETFATHGGYLSSNLCVTWYYSIHPLVLSPVARDSVAGVSASLLSYLTNFNVQLAKDQDFLKSSLEYPRCFHSGKLWLFMPCVLLHFPAGMLNKDNCCVCMAVQLEREFHLCSFGVSGYCSLQQVLCGFLRKFLPKP